LYCMNLDKLTIMVPLLINLRAFDIYPKDEMCNLVVANSRHICSPPQPLDLPS
jgi:hypothetical protein